MKTATTLTLSLLFCLFSFNLSAQHKGGLEEGKFVQVTSAVYSGVRASVTEQGILLFKYFPQKRKRPFPRPHTRYQFLDIPKEVQGRKVISVNVIKKKGKDDINKYFISSITYQDGDDGEKTIKVKVE